MNTAVTLVCILLLLYVIQDDQPKKDLVLAPDGNYYKVVIDYEDQVQAAALIAEINTFTVQLIKKLKQTYRQRDFMPKTAEEIKGFEVASILSKKYRSESLSENKPKSAYDTSYTQNKGEIISLCLREKQSGKNKFHSIEILKFVMLHELAHIVTPELNHSPLFWNNFRFLLEFCKRHGLYDAPNFTKKNEVYCGLNIEYNPMYDNLNTKSYFSKTLTEISPVPINL